MKHPSIFLSESSATHAGFSISQRSWPCRGNKENHAWLFYRGPGGNRTVDGEEDRRFREIWDFPRPDFYFLRAGGGAGVVIQKYARLSKDAKWIEELHVDAVKFLDRVPHQF